MWLSEAKSANLYSVAAKLGADGRDDAGAWNQGRPIHPLSLGAALRTRDREADAPLPGPRSGSWRVDDIYVQVGGKWKYLYWAVDRR
jgi:hypothetical protein